MKNQMLDTIEVVIDAKIKKESPEWANPSRCALVNFFSKIYPNRKDIKAGISYVAVGRHTYLLDEPFGRDECKKVGKRQPWCAFWKPRYVFHTTARLSKP